MRIQDLTLEEKCRMLGGASSWRTHPIERCGVPVIKMSDGPNGVRGDNTGSSGTPGIAIPVGIAMGATWNPDLIGELGELLGREAVRKGAHVLLAPTVNLHRTPIGGRVFECYSEDPELTARLAVEFVKGVQSNNVGVTVKHFAANDTEVDRMTVDAQVDERVLRELYLRPFEAAVKEAGAWGIMSAYNRLNGEHCAENRWLLNDVLREEWGFDGYVVSDWYGFHDTVGAAKAGLTVPMPGPRTIYGAALEGAVKAGDVTEERVDELVASLVKLIERTNAAELSSEREEQTVDDPTERALCRRAVSEGAVLLRNQGDALPLAPDMSVAVVGPNAADTRVMGGGSASLAPLPFTPLLDVLGERFTSVTHEPGVRIDRMPPPATERVLRTPDGEPGLRVEFRNGHDETAPVVYSDTARASMVRYFGSTPAGVEGNAFHVTLTGTYVPEISGRHLFSAVMTGGGVVEVGGTTVFEDPDRRLPRGKMFFGQGSEEQTATVDCVAGEPVELRFTCTGIVGFAGLRVGVRKPDPEDLFDRAVDAARGADAAIVVVGTNDEWETEGEDRTTIALPGDQDALVSAVAAVNPRTIVVVNAGSPVSMPWVDDVQAILLTYFGGIEMGNGVADVLLGDADPGGRLPVTYPRALEDSPAMASYEPTEGLQRYAEGLFIGYRGHDRSGVEPLFPFGHGLSYGAATWGEPSAPTSVPAGDDVEVRVTLTSDSDRDTTVVPQVYVSPRQPVVERADKELAAWTKIVVPAGGSVDCTIRVPGTAFRRWDTDAGAWVVDPGDYDLLLSESAGSAVHAARVTLT